MATGAIYSDSLLSITEDAILFRGYGLFGGDRLVAFADIDKIALKSPTLWNGKWWRCGTGDFRTWFPQDNDRQNRDIIFVAHVRSSWWRIGFTTEDSFRVASILQERVPIDKSSDVILFQLPDLHVRG